MAYNEKLTNRLRDLLKDVENVVEKKMFRGITFMVNGKMCISAGDQQIMCRIDPAVHEVVIQKDGVKTVVMKGKEYKGFVYVHEDMLPADKDLAYWVELSLDFNKRAKASAKKKKKQINF